MKKHVLLVMAALLGALVLSATNAYPADRLGFMEFLGQRVVCHKVDGVHQCEVADSGEFDIVAVVSLEGSDITSFNAETAFHITVAGFSFDDVLGSDPAYEPGRHQATFVRTAPDDDGRPKRYLRVLLHWNSHRLNAFIRGRTPELLIPLMAGGYVGWETGGIDDATAAHVEFAGQAQADFDVAVTGYVYTRHIERWKQPFDVSTVWLMGVGRPPVPPGPPDPKCIPPCYSLPDGTCECPR